jgi:hypothetical protein
LNRSTRLGDQALEAVWSPASESGGLKRLRFADDAMCSSSTSSLMENANTGQANRCTLFDAICVAVLSARYARIFVKTKG